VRVSLEGVKFKETDLDRLKAIPSLESLYLSGDSVTDDAVGHLKGLTQLQSLGLSNNNVTDLGVEYLKDLHQLWTLNLSYTQITDAALASLSGFASLLYLDIVDTPNVDWKAVDNLKRSLPKCWIYLGEPDPGPLEPDPEICPGTSLPNAELHWP